MSDMDQTHDQHDPGVRTWETNADEFGQMDSGEGWPFAARVACSVEPGSHADGPVTRVTGEGKVTAQAFADRAGTSAPRVMRYLRAWQKAADADVVPHAELLTPDSLPEIPEDTEYSWLTPSGSLRYGETKTKPTGGRPRDSKPEHAVKIIERRGVDQVVEAMSDDQRREMFRALDERENEQVVMPPDPPFKPERERHADRAIQADQFPTAKYLAAMSALEEIALLMQSKDETVATEAREALEDARKSIDQMLTDAAFDQITQRNVKEAQ